MKAAGAEVSVLDSVLLHGYLEGKEGLSELARATEAIRNGAADGRPSQQSLTQREIEVMHLVASGYANKEIGSRLGLSTKTINNHLTSILNKLGVDDRTAATVRCLRMGYIRLEDT